MVTFSHPRACWQSDQRAPLAAAVPQLVHIYSCARVTGVHSHPLSCLSEAKQSAANHNSARNTCFSFAKTWEFLAHFTLLTDLESTRESLTAPEYPEITPGAGRIHEYDPWHRPLMLSDFLRKTHLLQYRLHTLVVCVGAKTTMIQS